ncbi:MAG: 16S rRNA (guanine(966)-N(2))-methyltransferase RsmD [bacterium]|nr:16S rRNA (guanine(966)-N(2))-methyltransferase RsmD [bacterium]
MRVIAGTAKRIPLKTIEGMETRPTTDRIKETLFNMLQPYLLDAVFLDLFSGSGAIGIEALSRGAKKAYFVESAPSAVSCIRENLRNTKLADKAEILPYDVKKALHVLEGRKLSADLVFMDPPYRHEYEKEVLTQLSASSLIHKDTLLIVEASLDTTFDYLNELSFVCTRQKTYKTNQHIFLYRKEK